MMLSSPRPKVTGLAPTGYRRASRPPTTRTIAAIIALAPAKDCGASGAHGRTERPSHKIPPAWYLRQPASWEPARPALTGRSGRTGPGNQVLEPFLAGLRH